MASPLSKSIAFPTGQKYDQPIGLYINGEWRESKDTIDVINPSNGEVITSVYAAQESDVDNAVSSARKAFKTWKKLAGEERATLMNRLADLLEKNAETVAGIEALDAGKPQFSNALPDIEGSVSILRYCAGWADKIYGNVIPSGPDKLLTSKRIPYGVVSQIVPWNYPLNMAMWKIAPALCAGNCIVIKSSESSPLSLLYFAELVNDAGFPPGVLNIISGLGSVAGARMASHPDVDKIAFTGSTKTGKEIQKLASSNLKTVTLECGGKSPLIVFDDAKLDQAIYWAAFGIMYNTGQICTANSRVLVQDTIYDEFIQKFKAHVQENWFIGSPFDKKSTMGPVINKSQFEKVKGYIQKGKDEGAKLVIGDEPVTFESGYWIHPTIFVDCTQDMSIVKDEIFGPVVAISKFHSQEEAIELANDTEYGLAAMVFSKDIVTANTVASQLEAGTVYINSSNDDNIRVPFGGFKMSGTGSELGMEGVLAYTKIQAIHTNLTRD
ncbi:Aldehyde dehydrogenase [NAD(P)+] 1 [Komagataella phaffii CBS 7435]|uniref:Cytoplasmic aldehyde dehydrogenase, involved in ethanol oxidation and beta-alanine biosynthesis n=2 Tax=Komagataella phaffii TaxID=460519 RepID=C4R0Q6_KOMPG|nr:Cytoplasmic aldehyde dehydrogenase, involved in ethanol oxidation and beta-alanine biosynthesis [Komagataella phaffii GS115]AOA62394.1 GQ67_00496T0 [Komagataella phaffii]CAH2448401.1 Aldehyde dehydrogenase [NAD(P)+] 1 [Komagataella phaffii CBS 7435]AOA67058.1 GQ68_00892T0 [Komagataella phaffii GS115]CAY69080.1 Cytoplasmic aldehyde dehydrogenase, involved in ethanol oxidation and beta-alanine biosynthesis [Komagataella phaffii GS115]CCA38525.1 Aldehyde dehydrogenase [NAD(P)+] 1 [Komagataella